MEIPFALLLLDDARLLQQVIGDHSAHWIGLMIELNVHVLAESARVVVAVRLGVAERLENGVTLDENVFHSTTYNKSQLFNVNSKNIYNMKLVAQR